MNDNSFDITLKDYSKIVDKNTEMLHLKTNHESHKFIRGTLLL